MTGEVSRLQKRRAENIIWNAANSYSFNPDFRAYDDVGQAELYWNCIFGAARKHYEYHKLAALFKAFDQYEDADMYNALLWLGLENALYQKELPSRPALSELRGQYAKALTAQLGTPDSSRFYECMAAAHFRRALGQEPKLDLYDIKLMDELEFSPEMTTDDIVERSKELFERWFQISTELRKKERSMLPGLFGKRKGKQGKPREGLFGRGFAEHPSNAYGGADGERSPDNEGLHSKLTLEQLREFMESKYGEPMFSESKMIEAERAVCSGSHTGCHLLFTRGEVIKDKIQNAFEALQKQKEAQQIEKNRQSFYDNYNRNMTSIMALAGKIQNSILLHLHPSDIRANSGRLCGGTVWRATELDDDRVFTKKENSEQGDLSVDILLDASTSQKYRQEAVSTQGYMIAESLSRCGIPCRVMSFCSMTGFTILRVFRDYNERGKNEKIFDYVSNGCNRDGLAIKAAHYLIKDTPYEHKILIVLSDVKPNDVRKVCDRNDNEIAQYESGAGLIDTAHEVRRLRADGIAVVCVFTGTDEDIPSAKMVYGRDFARIQSLDKFADTVGVLIQNQIKII